jgi:hypothetical protein
VYGELDMTVIVILEPISRKQPMVMNESRPGMTSSNAKLPRFQGCLSAILNPEPGKY